MKENIKPSGKVFIYRGDINDENLIVAENLVVNSGLAITANRMISNSAMPTHIGVGTGTTAAAAGQTALVTPLDSRVAASGAVITTTVTNDTAQYTATFNAGVAVGAWTEAGLFTAISAGSMFSRVTFLPQNKGALDVFTVVWEIKFQ